MDGCLHHRIRFCIEDFIAHEVITEYTPQWRVKPKLRMEEDAVNAILIHYLSWLENYL